MRRGLSLAVVAALALIAGAANAIDERAGSSGECAAPASLTAIEPALTHSAAKIAGGEPLTIVAIGSSSTEGVGASRRRFSYPSRLAAELGRRYPQHPIRVLNQGKGGEEVPQMLPRLDRDVLAAHPDLVIWQLGTNAVLRRRKAADDRPLIENGIARLKAAGADIVLMDVQYAPRVLARPGYQAMEQLIADLAERAHVGLFRRFAIMRYWHGEEDAGVPAMIGPDGLHMNDDGYGCLAADLAEALAANWRGQRTAPEAAVASRPHSAAAHIAPIALSPR